MRWRRRHLSLRGRLALMSAAAVTVGIASVSLFAWWSTEQSMRSQIDQALLSGPMSARVRAVDSSAPVPFNAEQLCTALTSAASTMLESAIGSLQVIRADGSTCAPPSMALIPVTGPDLATAAGGPAQPARTATNADGVRVRVISFPLGNGYAVMLSRDLTEVDNTLRALALALGLASGLGAIGALTAGWIVARTGLRPVNDLTRAAEQIAATQDFDVPIEITGDDEVARLAGAFNKMTIALEAAWDRQQQLVADASHELRTPLTSLRTNIELLIRSDQQNRPLPGADRQELLHSVSAQLRELSALASELSLLANEGPATALVPVRLDEVVQRAVQRAVHRGEHRIGTDLQPWIVVGNPGSLERAVLNLLDNAVKFSPPDSTVRVRLRAGVLEVIDEGPGIPESERPQVFQRFWRSPSARSMPGSGLGLAIVAEVAAVHGGRVGVGESPTGGAVMALALPGSAPGG